MKLRITKIFKGKNGIAGHYSSFADFLIHASEKDKKAVIRQAAERANEDQLKVFTEAQLKVN